MRGARLFTVVLGNLRRSRNHFLLASIGIVVGIATFAFFLSLGLGVRQVVLGKIFPLDKLEVVPKSLELNISVLRMGMGQDSLDDDMVAKLAAIPAVEAVYPKMKLTVGSIAYGGEALFGSDLRSEVVADGIDPKLVADEINQDGFEFVDYDHPERLAGEPVVECTEDSQCGENMYCGRPAGSTTEPENRRKKARRKPKPKPKPRPKPKLKTDAQTPASIRTPTRFQPSVPNSAPSKPPAGKADTAKPAAGKAAAGKTDEEIAAEKAAAIKAAAEKAAAEKLAAKKAAAEKAAAEAEAEQAEIKVCRHYVPVVVSDHIVELYNGTLRRAHGFPQLNPDAVRGFKFDLIIGQSMVASSNKDRIIHDRAMFVGSTDKAIPLGFTLPLGYVQRYNVEFGNESDAEAYHSVIVEVRSKDDVAAVAKAVADLDLEVKDTNAEEAAMLIAVFMMVFGLVSAVIVGIAAVNIMHVFFMLVYERQREIGIMRAVGASQGDIGRIILGEAGVLGTIAGSAGVLLAYGAAELFDYVSAQYVPDFPYKPTTYFEFPWWLIAAALGFSISFCVLGALLPARRAARMEPARVLSGN